MGGKIETHQYIHLRLLSLINELYIPAGRLKEHLKSWPGDESQQTYKHLVDGIRSSLKSCDLICGDLENWSELQLGKEAVYSGNTQFQAQLIIKIIKALAGDDWKAENNVKDLRNGKINLTLFGWALHRLLLLLAKFPQSGCLKINSSYTDTFGVFSISGIETATLCGLAESLLQENHCWGVADRTLDYCYDILSLYGGNLWSEKNETHGSTVYFSIPVIKNF
ncbi:MAG: hypothetical protein H7Y13_11045 [Sphingobacteriaceae bacterium]|nr:hypothetical protein [Sphingobacteriaceae bacterium]